MSRNGKTALSAGLIVCALLAGVAHAAAAMISLDEASGPHVFAANDIEAALRAREITVRREDRRQLNSVTRERVRIRFIDADRWAAAQKLPSIAAEGFALRRQSFEGHEDLFIIARDAGGAMYGGLELAEQIQLRGVEGVTDTDRNPHMAMRGTKFNIPLDLRNPSYSDMSDSAQENIATVWDFEFWRAYLDTLARDRYNFVSLWNLHPFPSMVKVPEFPDVALKDVWRSKIAFDEDYSTRTVGLVTPAMLANKEIVAQLSMEQKIDFWRRVMRYAKDRNIDFHVMTWNVFTYGVDGKYGITDAIDNPKTVDYYRASVREMFRTYPLLRGIGLTAGENMGAISGDASFEAKENWAFATYGQGVLDAARAEPSRQFRLIHRQHETRAQDIARTFAPLTRQPNVDFVFSFKYAQAHALSSTTQTFHKGYLESLGDLRTLWTVRNDDALMYRWAAPDFVREFIGRMPGEKTQGFYYGSDMWVWGREFLARDHDLSRQLEVEKHWLHFLLWGRMGYDPGLDNERIAALVAQRFPGVDAKQFLAMWQDASMIYPLVTGFHWADFDFQWYIEGCRSRPGPAKTASGFHSVDTFIHQPVHPGTSNITIPAYVAGVIAGKTPPGTTPLQVADRIDARARAVFASIAQFSRRGSSGHAELDATLTDIRLMASLGQYYAAKIRGATELALFRETLQPGHRTKAVEHLKLAAQRWAEYTQRANAAYRNPVWTNRVGIVDWKELDAEVANDIAIASTSVSAR
ncbi:MAG TPA: hypothetical protein VFU13_05740 [Steroidobacteraceae bacterium]|nr:hypothetical protein [Steroidobacteraceae bacterium]